MSRSLEQIEQSLRSKFAKADNYITEADYLSGLGATSPHRGDPVMSPDLGGGQGPGGAGRSVRQPAVWRNQGVEQSSKPRAIQKPRVDIKDVPKTDEPQSAAMPKVWRRGEPPPAAMQSTQQQQQAEKFLQGQGFKSSSAQDKLSQAAQAAAKDTGEMIATAKPGGFVSRMLDKFYPDKTRIEPKFTEPKEPEIRAVEPKTGIERHIDYYKQTDPIDTVGGKVVDILRGKSNESIENSLAEKYNLFKLQEAAEVTRQDLLMMAKSAADRHGVPLPVVLHALYKETGWMKNASAQVTARSPAGALGVMQIMPDTAKYLGLKDKDIFNPEKNIDAGVRYLAQNLQQYQDPRVALAAYNAGPNSKRVKQFAATGDAKYLPKETRKYVSDYNDDVEQQLARFYPDKKNRLATTATNTLAAVTGSKTAQAAKPIEHPVGTIIQPDWSKYNVGDLGSLEKIGPGRYRSSTGKIVTNAPELEKLPGSPKPETFLDKVKRTLPPALGGGGELVSKVFGGDKKPTPTSNAETDKIEPVKAQQTQQPKVDVRKEFEKEFAKQRAAQGSGGTFAWTNPVTGKTSEYTTAYKSEKSTADTGTNLATDTPEKPDAKGTKIPEPKSDNIDHKATSDRDRISKLVNQPEATSVLDTQPADSDSKKFTSAQEKWLGAADPTDPYILDRMNKSLPDEPAVEIPKLREAAGTNTNAKDSINTELADILRLAGRL